MRWCPTPFAEHAGPRDYQFFWAGSGRIREMPEVWFFEVVLNLLWGTYGNAHASLGFVSMDRVCMARSRARSGACFRSAAGIHGS
jgi:hypothetical protein